MMMKKRGKGKCKMHLILRSFSFFRLIHIEWVDEERRKKRIKEDSSQDIFPFLLLETKNEVKIGSPVN